MRSKATIITLFVLTLAYLVVYVGMWKWMVCRTWVPSGKSMQLTRLAGSPASPNDYAGDGQQGVVRQMLSPGRHFFTPWEYNTRMVEDFEVPPGHIALVKNNIGKDLPPGRFLAGPDEKGTQKAVLTAGIWRLNEFGQSHYVQPAYQQNGKVQTQPMTFIPPGYVGVQTLTEGPEKGILPTVLQAGYYAINPEEINVKVVGVGYDVMDMHVDYETAQVKDHDGNLKTVQKPKEGTGVSFPLADGKQMYLDITVVWGVYPEDAPRIVREYGTLDMLEEKIIIPQVVSICKNAGSDLTTQNFIAGQTREKFQERFTQELQKIGKEKGIHFLIALVRGFHPDSEIAETIQAKMLAEEEMITLAAERDRDAVAADLEAAKRKVQTALRDFDAETAALVAGEKEEGNKQAATAKAEADRKVAGIDKEVALIDAKGVQIAGKAEADVAKKLAEAKADLLRLMVTAYGGAESYNLAMFAQNLSEDLQVEYRYAGAGTLWTDTTRSTEDLAARRMLATQPVTAAPPAKSAKPAR